MLRRFGLRLIPAILVLSTLAASFSSTPAQAVTGSDFQAGHIIDDSIFYDNTSMSVQDVQNFLNSQMPNCDPSGSQIFTGYYKSNTAYFPTAQYPNGHTYTTADNVKRSQLDTAFPAPYTCLRNYYENTTTKVNNIGAPTTIPSGAISAAQIIVNAGNDYNISPKVLIVLLQKESGLVTDSWPWPTEYRTATGYGCPDTSGCDATYYGFYNQVHNAARQFRLYANNPNNYNYTIGANQINYQTPRYVTVNGSTVDCGLANVNIVNQATASLYDYTPYTPNAAALANLYGTGDACSAYGNRNFWRTYNDWFGSTLTGNCYGTAAGTTSDILFRKYQKGIDVGSLVDYSGTTSGCVEDHVWSSDYSAWQAHIASNLPTVDPANDIVRFADLDGNGIDDPIVIGIHNTASGMVEFHVWDPTMQRWRVHAISNLPTSAMTNTTIEFGDVNGDGIDEPVAIGYTGTSTGMIEFHYWNAGLQSWNRHVVSSMPVIDPAKFNIKFADLDGSGTDHAVIIGVSATSTSMVEFHVMNTNLQGFQAHYISNLPTSALTSGNDTFDFADLYGTGQDLGIVIGRHNTSTGKVEFHVWNPGFGSWKTHYVSNYATGS